MLPALLARLAAVGFLIAMTLHTVAYGQILMVARNGPTEVSDLVSVLWLSLSAALLVLGAIVWIKAPSASPGRRSTLLLAAAFPFAVAVLQVVFMGFIPPVAIMALVAALTAASALVRPAKTPATAASHV